MEKKIIESFGSEILCYQLKTTRQKRRVVKTTAEKKLLRLHKERKQIWKQQRNLGYVDVHPPIVKGWKRFFVLREDVARCKDALFYQNILNKINKTEYCNRKDFKRKQRYSSKRKKWIRIEQTVLQPEHSDFVKLHFTEKEKVLFEQQYVKHKWRKELVKVFVFKEQWRFVLRTRQNLITKVKAVDIELLKREKKISDYLQKTNAGYELRRLLGDSSGGWEKRNNIPKAKYRSKKKTLIEILDEIKMND
jgi:hypothetical protein